MKLKLPNSKLKLAGGIEKGDVIVLRHSRFGVQGHLIISDDFQGFYRVLNLDTSILWSENFGSMSCIIDNVNEKLANNTELEFIKVIKAKNMTVEENV